MKIIGHAGAAGLAPRNTLAGIRKALEHHVDEVEFDVRVTGDNVPIMCHDLELTDASGTMLNVHDHSYAELKQHKPDLPTLEEALKLINGKTVTHVELKPGEAIKPVVAVLKRYIKNGMYSSDNLVLASRNGDTLRQLHDALPDIPKAVIEFWSSVRAVRNARSVGTKRLSMLEFWLWPGFIRSMARSGYQIYSFPSTYPHKEKRMARFGRAGQSNHPELIKSWQKAGLAGVFTDYPDRFEK